MFLAIYLKPLISSDEADIFYPYTNIFFWVSFITFKRI